jgi:phosphoribosylaminoimidazolecarboxamide formyltransferase/IMP cyclohydrolase
VVEKVGDLRYGENPGQPAALFRDARKTRLSFIDAVQLQGKELSYNNWLDTDSAFKVSQELGLMEPAAVIIKHTNPCGTALGDTIEEAFSKAYSADPISAFGGIVALNRPLTKALALTLAEVFWEVILAPLFSPEAREILKAKQNLRLLELHDSVWTANAELEWRSVQGGFLVQERDLQPNSHETWTLVTKRSPSEAELRDLVFAWKVVKHVRSNAIVLAKHRQTVGVGAGQMNRVGAAEIALKQAGKNTRGAVMASDAFLPFPDVVRMASKHGVWAIVQTGGSLKDKESTDAADE